MSAIHLVFILLVVGMSRSASDFDYYSSEYGPDQWSTLFPTCGGENQSPIDIVLDDVTLNKTLGLFTHELFADKIKGITLVNDGHELVAQVTSGGYTINNSSLLDGAFKLEQFHFHWATTSSSGGSEHTINGKQEYGEMHLVHYNTKYASFTAAKDKGDGLAVLAFFMQATYPQDNLAFSRLLDLLSNGTINQQDDSYVYTQDQLFSVETLLPHDISMYYRYYGSLTTPTCDESVQWTVFNEPIMISDEQATLLSTSLTTNTTTADQPLNNNFRPTQPLNSRAVTYPLPLTQCNSSTKMHLSIGLMLSFLVPFLTQFY